MSVADSHLKEKKSWDQTWEKVFKENEWGKYPSETLIRFVAQNFYRSTRRNVKILEVGSGPGANVWYMAKEGFDVYGVEGSRTAVDRAKVRLNKENLKADLRVGDIIRLPYKDRMFDAVADSECLAHNPAENMDTILSEIKRVLKVGGLFYSRTFTDEVYMGKTQTKIGNREYKDVSDGPFGGRGFIRLMAKNDIYELYGKYFNILSIDKHEYTINNSAILISEWVIICANEK